MCMKGSASHWWLNMDYPNILLQVEVIVHNCILHDLCMPAATLILPFSQLKRVCARFAALFDCVV